MKNQPSRMKPPASVVQVTLTGITGAPSKLRLLLSSLRECACQIYSNAQGQRSKPGVKWSKAGEGNLSKTVVTTHFLLLGFR